MRDMLLVARRVTHSHSQMGNPHGQSSRVTLPTFGMIHQGVFIDIIEIMWNHQPFQIYHVSWISIIATVGFRFLPCATHAHPPDLLLVWPVDESGKTRERTLSCPENGADLVFVEECLFTYLKHVNLISTTHWSMMINGWHDSGKQPTIIPSWIWLWYFFRMICSSAKRASNSWYLAEKWSACETLRFCYCGATQKGQVAQAWFLGRTVQKSNQCQFLAYSDGKIESGIQKHDTHTNLSQTAFDSPFVSKYH